MAARVSSKHQSGESELPFRDVASTLTPNPLRARLNAGKPAIGTSVVSWSPAIVEIAAYAGLDFVRLDTEHSWRRDESLDHLIRAALLRQIVPVVRVEGSDLALVRKVLELGAGGVIVTEIETAKDARDLVRASKFPPNGTRGYSSLCESAGWGSAPAREWVEWSDTEPLIGIMVETPGILDDVDDIMAVPGIDFAFFGPADFSMNLGLRAPAKADARLQQGLERTVKAARNAGKHVMATSGSSADEIAKVLGLGVSFVEVPNDLASVRVGWSAARTNMLKVLGN